MPRRNLVPATIISFIVIRFWHERTTAEAHMEFDCSPPIKLQIETLIRRRMETATAKSQLFP